jgi:dTDP-4-amino-4,6-dideoxygalactose transaminase
VTIAHNRPWLTEADNAAVAEALASGWIAPGPRVAELEAAFVAMLGGGAACAVSSGSAALFLALKMLGAEAGDSVALPTYSCSALLNAVAMCGARPALVDVRSDDFTIDAGKLERQAPDARFVIAVHTYGATADVAALKAGGRVVIEDCCQSLGGLQGLVGDAAVFSFYATKMITGGHGGLVWDRQGRVAEAVRDYVMFDGRPDWKLRFNLQFTDLQAALVLSQLKRIDEIRARRLALHRSYRTALPAWAGIQAGFEGDDAIPYRFVLRTDSGKRNALRGSFSAANIRTIVPTEPWELLHRYLGQPVSDFPTAEAIASETLSLPLYPALLPEEAELVTNVLKAST